jgi:hypothetical protein
MLRVQAAEPVARTISLSRFARRPVLRTARV